MILNKKLILYLIFLQCFFVFMNLPYLSGQKIFAPASFVSDTYLDDFRHKGENKITPRDKIGAHDYLSQERNFLKFYRESIKNGDLPFWSETTFGGLSQDDSLIYSYLSIFNFFNFHLRSKI